ncbi:glycosyltransferase family 4 protein [Nocardioides sp. SR21]|uniref:glycosyltransferase family 4 protein n=1 Tax=Nocardioides sp. SR21 TaxID=2919501 RepID=UPI001FAA4E73|nr:glycosyltransferase family 4 protein [Nocardioides sp. SR21]
MRVLHVNKFLHRRGGAEGYLLDLAALQRAEGDETAFFGMAHPDNDQESAGTPPSYVAFDVAPSGPRATARVVGRMLWSREAGRGMEEALDAFRPDVVHAHNIYHQLSPSVVRAAARRGVPVVLTMHDYKLACPTYQLMDHGRPCTACITGGPWQAVKRRCKDGSLGASTAAALEVSLHRRLGAYDGLGRLIAPSRFLADTMAAAGVYPDRIRVIPNFTELDVPRPTVRASGRAVYAGRLSSEKGVDTLIQAIGLASAGLADLPGVLLDVAGDGPERGALESLAADVAPGRVRFHGRLPREALVELVGSATLSAVPSRWHENQPLAVLESYALGVPVLATDLGGLPEMVDETTGWVVPADDPVAMAQALHAALRDPVEAVLRGKRARRIAEERHDPGRHLDAIRAVYEEAGART